MKIPIKISLMFFPKGSIKQYSIISSDNSLVPNRWQAIIWTNDGLSYWRIYASLGLNELTVATLSVEECNETMNSLS